MEAAQSIGLTGAGVALWVVLPIALRNALPSLGNNFISLFKDTSIAAVIAVPELTFQARKINNESFRVIEVWLITSLIYVADLRADRLGAAAARKALSEVLRAARHAELSNVFAPRPRASCDGLLITVCGLGASPSRRRRCSASVVRPGAHLWRRRSPLRSACVAVDVVRGHAGAGAHLSPPSTCRPDSGVSPGPITAGIFALAVFCAAHVGETLSGALIAHTRGADRCCARDRPDLRPDARPCARAAGDAPDRAQSRQHRGRDRQGVIAALGDRGGRASAHHPGDHRPHLQDDGVLCSCRRPLPRHQSRHRHWAARGWSGASGCARRKRGHRSSPSGTSPNPSVRTRCCSGVDLDVHAGRRGVDHRRQRLRQDDASTLRRPAGTVRCRRDPARRRAYWAIAAKAAGGCG